MGKNKFKNILTIAILTVLLTMGTTLAQDNSGSGTTTDQDKTTTGQNQSGNDQNNMSTSGNQDEATFRSTAQQLATDLVTRLNLQQDKTSDISDIIVDYRNDIADIKKDQSNNYGNTTGMTGNGTGTDMSGNKGQTGSGTDMTGNNGDMVGGSNSSMMKAYRDADQKANDKIESAIGKGNVPQYMNIKRDWWRDVKERVHASLHSSSMGSGSGSDMMNNGTTGSGTKKGKGTKSGTSKTGTGTDMGTGTDRGTGTGTGTDRGTGTGTGTHRGTDSSSHSGNSGSGSGSGGY